MHQPPLGLYSSSCKWKSTPEAAAEPLLASLLNCPVAIKLEATPGTFAEPLGPATHTSSLPQTPAHTPDAALQSSNTLTGGHAQAGQAFNALQGSVGGPTAQGDAGSGTACAPDGTRDSKLRERLRWQLESAAADAAVCVLSGAAQVQGSEQHAAAATAHVSGGSQPISREPGQIASETMSLPADLRTLSGNVPCGTPSQYESVPGSAGGSQQCFVSSEGTPHCAVPASQGNPLQLQGGGSQACHSQPAHGVGSPSQDWHPIGLSSPSMPAARPHGQPSTPMKATPSPQRQPMQATSTAPVSSTQPSSLLRCGLTVMHRTAPDHSTTTPPDPGVQNACSLADTSSSMQHGVCATLLASGQLCVDQARQCLGGIENPCMVQVPVQGGNYGVQHSDVTPFRGMDAAHNTNRACAPGWAALPASLGGSQARTWPSNVHMQHVVPPNAKRACHSNVPEWQQLIASPPATPKAPCKLSAADRDMLDADLWGEVFSPTPLPHQPAAAVHCGSSSQLRAVAGAQTHMVATAETLARLRGDPCMSAACQAWLGDDMRRFRGLMQQQGVLQAVPYASQDVEVSRTILDAVGEAMRAVQQGQLFLWMAGFTLLPTGVVLAATAADNGGFWEAFDAQALPHLAAEVHMVAELWGDVQGSRELAAALGGLSLEQALEVVAEGYGRCVGMPSI
jgi:hypothetical protein